jgi:Uma2 family endonuclease
MSGGAARKKATYQDVIDAPANHVAQIVAGVLYTFPRPALPHANVASALAHYIGGPFHRDPRGPGGWWIFFEPELHFGEDVLVPDLAGWRRTRMSRIEDVPFLTLAPDWICEVLSPSTERLDRKAKLEVYAREKVSHVWLVEPRAHTLELLRLEDDGKWKLLGVHAEDETPRAEPFEAIELALADLWLKE